MVERSPEKIIQRAKELGQKVFDEEKAVWERHLQDLSEKKKLTWLETEQDKSEAILQIMPVFLADGKVLLENIIIGEENAEILNSRFMEWYPSYATIKKQYSDFRIKLSKHEKLVFDAEVKEQEKVFLKSKMISHLFESKYDAGISKFSLSVYYTVVSFRQFQLLRKDFLTQYIQNIKSPVSGIGFNSPLSKEQKTKLWKKCIDDNLIAADTSEENFIAAFSPKELPINFKPIRWINKNQRNNPSQSIIYALIDALEAPYNKRTFHKIFTDEQGILISLSKRRMDNNYIGWIGDFKKTLNT